VKNQFLLLFLSAYSFVLSGQQTKIFPGADENTLSRAQYFSWINNTNEGPTAKQTMINLDFFQWLHDEYGMILDIYAFDAGPEAFILTVLRNNFHKDLILFIKRQNQWVRV